MVHPKPQSNQNSKHKQTQRNKNKDTVLLKDLVDLIEKIRLFHTEGFRHMLVYFSYLIIGQKKTNRSEKSCAEQTKYNLDGSW